MSMGRSVNLRAWWVAGLFAVLSVGGLVSLYACQANRQRLVEVFDNGPIGGPPGESEGYIWVGANEEPTEGKNWKTVDEKSLTDEQRRRIRAR